MQTRIITDVQDFYRLEEEWKRLEENDTSITYYSSFEYVRAWLDSYKSDKNIQLLIIVIYENKRAICIAPFMIIKNKKMFISINTLKFLGEGDYLNILIDMNFKRKKACIKEVFDILKKNNKLFDKIHLTHIKYDSELALYFLKSDIYNKDFSYLIECPYMDFNKYSNFDEYIKDKFKLSDIKYYINKLKKDTDYSFKVIYGNENNLLNEIANLHKFEKNYLIKNNNRYERASLFEDKRRFSYIEDIYNTSNNTVTFLLKDKEQNILIYYTCYKYNNILYFWNTAYNPIYAKYNLTRILNYEVFKFIFENKFVNIFDYGAGRYPWKFKWTGDFIFDYELKIWSNNKRAKKLSKIHKLYSKFK